MLSGRSRLFLGIRGVCGGRLHVLIFASAKIAARLCGHIFSRPRKSQMHDAHVLS